MSLQLKLLRLQSQLTLDQLARGAGLTRSYVSKLERGVCKPSIAAATELANVLGAPVERIFRSDDPGDPVSITRAPDAAPGAGARMVSGAVPGGSLSAFVLSPSVERLRNPSSRHRGEEFVYVLSGSVELQLADRIDILHAGDTAHFDSTVPHRITSLSEPEAKLLIVAAPLVLEAGTS